MVKRRADLLENESVSTVIWDSSAIGISYNHIEVVQNKFLRFIGINPALW